MGYWNIGRSRKFYSSQVNEITRLLERYVRESNQNVDVSKYLALCEQLGQEPDPDKMPLDASAFPVEVQVAFFVFDLLSDRWEGMSGTYLGKDWSPAKFIMETFEIEDIKTIVFFAKLYDNILMKERAEAASKRQKAEERRAKTKTSMSR